MKARPLGRKGVVVGDRVRVVGDDSGAEGSLARIVEVSERTTVLRRTADDDDPVERVVVANADQLVVVTALADPEPRPRLMLPPTAVPSPSGASARGITPSASSTSIPAAARRRRRGRTRRRRRRWPRVRPAGSASARRAGWSRPPRRSRAGSRRPRGAARGGRRRPAPSASGAARKPRHRLEPAHVGADDSLEELHRIAAVHPREAARGAAIGDAHRGAHGTMAGTRGGRDGDGSLHVDSLRRREAGHSAVEAVPRRVTSVHARRAVTGTMDGLHRTVTERDRHDRRSSRPPSSASRRRMRGPPRGPCGRADAWPPCSRRTSSASAA